MYCIFEKFLKEWGARKITRKMVGEMWWGYGCFLELHILLNAL